MKLIGFDIGGTKCAVILGEQDNGSMPEIIDKVVFPTKRGPDATINELLSVMESIIHKHGLSLEDISGIGISCGGPLDSRKGVILSPPNLPGWDNIHIVEMIEKKFSIPTSIMNDANACALAEWKYGAGKGYDNVIFFTFGTGMGAGLILDGHLYSGTSDLAGEVGHIRLSEHGPSGFGKQGSFEGWCSGGGIAQLGQTMARQRIQLGQQTMYCKSLQELDSVTARSISEAAYNGDETAIEVYRTVAEYLGRGLATIVDILNPQVIILGSIYGRSKGLIEREMMKKLQAEAIDSSFRHCSIVPAGLGENIGDIAALVLADVAQKKNSNTI